MKSFPFLTAHLLSPSVIVLFFCYLLNNSYTWCQTIHTHRLTTAPAAICERNGVPKLIAAPDKSVILAEFHRKDDTYRHENVYLHSYQLRKQQPTLPTCQLQWFQPITAIHEPGMAYQGTFALKTALAVVGHQKDRHHDGTNTMIQFFNYGGKPIGPLQKLSCYYEQVTGFAEQFHSSPDQKCFLWFSTNEAQSAI